MERFIKLPESFYDRWRGHPKTITLAVYLLFRAAWKDMEVAGIEVRRGELLTSLSELSRETKLTVSEVRTSLNHLVVQGFVSKALNKADNKALRKAMTRLTICNFDSYNGVLKGVSKALNKADNKASNTILEKFPPLSPLKEKASSPTPPTEKENIPPYNPPLKEIIEENNSIELKKKNGDLEIFDEGIGADVAPQEKTLTPTPSPKGKIAYREFVLMTEEEYNKLVERFGKEGADWMIDKLDNAKGSKGYKYKSDYRAILNWVVKEYEKEKQQNNGRNSNNRTDISQTNPRRGETDTTASCWQDYEASLQRAYSERGIREDSSLSLSDSGGEPQ